MERQEEAPKKTIDGRSFALRIFPAYNCKVGTSVSQVRATPWHSGSVRLAPASLTNVPPISSLLRLDCRLCHIFLYITLALL